MDDLLHDLGHKRKTVVDLIRFILNQSEKAASNFSIFLGAGASVTSGIRSGQELIYTWEKEILEEEGLTISDKDLFFSKEDNQSWYDRSNPYASLFEKRYDLQRQRRVFVEKEISEAKPSIGYAYLVKLIENGFFNTVFTTNFDDLLNEAFNRFSTLRPLVCAHDSSILGISVTSRSPKIIKLHGDYLFDNIKATIRETESLETNMRMKFQEFAKDFGLIVIGYGGQDRSIMDILSFLLSHEEYFKNGLYWCIKKGEKKISSELRQLLWKDRVYFVEIDGFDELMAFFNQKLNAGKLPIDDEFLGYEHQKRIVKDLTENHFLEQTESSILIEDCKRLNTRFADSMMNDFMAFVKDKQSQDAGKRYRRHPVKRESLIPLTKSEKDIIDKISTNAFVFNNKNKALQLIDQNDISTLEDSMFKVELLEMKADLSKNLDDNEIKDYFDELIRLNPAQQKYYIIAANRSHNYEQKKNYYKQAMIYFKNDYYTYNRYAECVINHVEDSMDKSSLHDDIIQAQIALETSINLYSSISNEARLLKARIINVGFQGQKDQKKKASKELADSVWELSTYAPITFSVLRECKDDRYSEENLKKSIEYYSYSDDSGLLEDCYKNLCVYYQEKHSFEDIKATWDNYESSFIPSDDFLIFKTRMLVDHEYVKEALNIINDHEQNSAFIKLKMKILSMQGDLEELDLYYDSLNNNDPDLKLVYLEASHKYTEMCLHYSMAIDKKEQLSENDVIQYSYALLQDKKYKECLSFLKPYYDNPAHKNGVIIINYLFAKKKDNPKYDVVKKVKELIIEHKYINYSDAEKVGAYALAEMKGEMYSYLRKELSKAPSFKYSVKDWPIIEKYRNDKTFIDLTSPNLC